MDLGTSCGSRIGQRTMLRFRTSGMQTFSVSVYMCVSQKLNMISDVSHAPPCKSTITCDNMNSDVTLCNLHEETYLPHTQDNGSSRFDG